MYSKRTLTILKGLKRIFRTKDRWTKNHLLKWHSELGKDFPLTHPLQYDKKIVHYNERPVYQVCVVGGINVVCNTLDGNKPSPVFSNFSCDIDDVAKAMGFYDDGTPYSRHNQLVNWNNSSRTAYKQFIDRIDKAIIKVEGALNGSD